MEKYQEKNLSVEARVENLLGLMTIDEKIGQLQCCMVMGDPSTVAEKFPHGIGEIVSFNQEQTPEEISAMNRGLIESFSGNRLNIPPVVHIEAVTGVVSPCATIFPSAIGLGATFNPDLVEEMADTVRLQMLSLGYRQALSPVMDVARDPRWGRLGETYGEDPALCGAMSAAYTRGLQTGNLSEGAIATGKHFLGYGLSEGGMNMASNPIPARELAEVYARPFQAAISEGNLQGVMNSYGTIDGEMIIGSENILTKLLREEMKFDGILVSDYMAIDRLVNNHICNDINEAGISALKAGLDVECPGVKAYSSNLAEAIAAGILDEQKLNMAVRRVLTVKFRLGLFDDPYPRTALLQKAFGDEVHEQRSLKAARESVVLLKNDGILPLPKNPGTIAVIGPHADSLRLLFGCYTLPAGLEMQMSNSLASDMAGMEGLEDFSPEQAAGEPAAEAYPGSDVLREQDSLNMILAQMLGESTPTIVDSIRAKCSDGRVLYSKGCDIAGTDRSMFAEALKTAEEADVIILTLGGKYGWGNNCTIGEGIDRDDIGLTGIQEEFAREIHKTGKPVVLVHMDARPLSSTFIRDNFNAIIENWFPGSTGGRALSDVLFGDFNPSGRMPVTAVRNAGQIPLYSGQRNGNGYYAKDTVGALTRYCEGTTEPLFFFGEGLSYTEFEYDKLEISPSVAPDGEVSVRLEVRNTGKRDGQEVVQLYVRDVIASMLRPAKELAGCKRLFLKAGEAASVEFKLRADQFAFIDENMRWKVESGEMRVSAGGSSTDIRLEGSFTITESRYIEPSTRGFFAKAVLL